MGEINERARKSSTPGCVAPYLRVFDTAVPARYDELLEIVFTGLQTSTLAGR